MGYSRRALGNRAERAIHLRKLPRVSGPRKRAFITGISGQDGSYLAELLLGKGYAVHGLLRRSSTINTHRLDGIYRDPHEADLPFVLHYGDLSDGVSMTNLVRQIEPDEIYHLGAQSHVRVSFDIPDYTAQTTGLGTLRILEAIYASGVERGFIRLRLRRCSGRRRRPRTRTRRSTRAAPMGWPKSSASGRRSTTAKPMVVRGQRRALQPRKCPAG